MLVGRVWALVTRTASAVQTMFARDPGALCQHSAPGPSGRLLQAWPPGARPQQPCLRGLSVLAASRGGGGGDSRGANGALEAAGRRAAPRPSSDLQSVPGIGRVNEQRLLSKGLTSVELLAEVFVERKKRNEAEMIAYLQVPWLFDTCAYVSCHGLLSALRPPLAGRADRRGDQAAARSEHRAAPGGDAHGRQGGGGGAGQPQAPDYAVRGGQHQRRQELVPAAHPQGERGAARHCRGAPLPASAGNTRAHPRQASERSLADLRFDTTGQGVESGDAELARAELARVASCHNQLSCSLSIEWLSRCLAPRSEVVCLCRHALGNAGQGVRRQACQRHTHCQLPLSAFSGDPEGLGRECHEARGIV